MANFNITMKRGGKTKQERKDAKSMKQHDANIARILDRKDLSAKADLLKATAKKQQADFEPEKANIYSRTEIEARKIANQPQKDALNFERQQYADDKPFADAVAKGALKQNFPKQFESIFGKGIPDLSGNQTISKSSSGVFTNKPLTDPAELLTNVGEGTPGNVAKKLISAPWKNRKLLRKKKQVKADWYRSKRKADRLSTILDR